MGIPGGLLDRAPGDAVNLSEAAQLCEQPLRWVAERIQSGGLRYEVRSHGDSSEWVVRVIDLWALFTDQNSHLEDSCESSSPHHTSDGPERSPVSPVDGVVCDINESRQGPLFQGDAHRRRGPARTLRGAGRMSPDLPYSLQSFRPWWYRPLLWGGSSMAISLLVLGVTVLRDRSALRRDLDHARSAQELHMTEFAQRLLELDQQREQTTEALVLESSAARRDFDTVMAQMELSNTQATLLSDQLSQSRDLLVSERAAWTSLLLETLDWMDESDALVGRQLAEIIDEEHEERLKLDSSWRARFADHAVNQDRLGIQIMQLTEFLEEQRSQGANVQSLLEIMNQQWTVSATSASETRGLLEAGLRDLTLRVDALNAQLEALHQTSLERAIDQGWLAGWLLPDGPHSRELVDRRDNSSEEKRQP